MIKIYGMGTCPNCIYTKAQINGRTEFEFIDIGTHVQLLKEFLAIRDTHPKYDNIRAEGKIGIPCFVLEDGTITLKPEDVGLKSRHED